MALPETQKGVLLTGVSETWETLKYEDHSTPQISSDDDVIIKNSYAGVNLIDSYFRKGIYPAELPTTLGREASGTIAAIGKSVTKYKVGDKVAYLNSNTFAQYTKISESKVQVIRLPDNISDENLKTLGSVLIQGLTAISFVEEAHKVEKGQNILIWAAAGGVGQILIQLAVQKGATAIAIASTKEKLDIASKLGAKYLINSSTDNIAEKVAEFTNNVGVDASFDSIGKDSFETSLKVLKKKGSFISYGNASGPVTPFPLSRLSEKNLRLLRPTLFNYVSTKEEFEFYSNILVKSIENGDLKFDLSKTYELKDYVEATKALEGRKTTGKLVLQIP